jgi:hypothetical protein
VKDQPAKSSDDVVVISEGSTSLATIKHGTSLKEAEKIIEAALKEKREVVGHKEELNLKGSSFVKISVSAVNIQSYDEKCMELQRLEMAEEQARVDAQLKTIVSRLKNKEITAEEYLKLKTAEVDKHTEIADKINDAFFERLKAIAPK